MGLSLISSDTLISALAMPRRFASDTSEARSRTASPASTGRLKRSFSVAVRNGRFIRAFRPGALRVHVNPLVVERGVGEKVDLLLRDRQVVGNTQLLTYVLGEFVEIVDD